MDSTRCFTVPAEAKGVRLDQFLLGAWPNAAEDGAEEPTRSVTCSRSQVQAWIASACVTVDGSATRAGKKLCGGESVLVAVPAPTEASVTAMPMDLDVLYEDAALLVLNKPAHLSVHPGAGDAQPTLVHGLLAHCRDLSGIGGVLRPGIVHRLDKGTTGALVVAKHDLAHRALAAQFAERSVDKRYLALVHAERLPGGANKEASGRIETLYGRHRGDRKRFSGRFFVPGARRRAITEWERLAGGHEPQLGALALLACTLHTGRTHQLRAHLSELGCPIVGDTLYGARRVVSTRLLAALDHQALHAWQISFTHPVTGEAMRISAPLPTSWREAARTLLTRAPNGGARSAAELSCV